MEEQRIYEASLLAKQQSILAARDVLLSIEEHNNLMNQSLLSELDEDNSTFFIDNDSGAGNTIVSDTFIEAPLNADDLLFIDNTNNDIIISYEEYSIARDTDCSSSTECI